MKKRLDQWLVDKKLAPSKTKAKDLVLSGSVYLKGKALLKPGALYSEEEINALLVESHELLKYVSRDGIKLESALEHLKLDLNQILS